MDWEWWLQGPLAKLIPGIIFMIGFGIWEGFSNARDSRKALREEQERRGRRNAVEIMDAQVDEQAVRAALAHSQTMTITEWDAVSTPFGMFTFPHHYPWTAKEQQLWGVWEVRIEKAGHSVDFPWGVIRGSRFFNHLKWGPARFVAAYRTREEAQYHEIHGAAPASEPRAELNE